MEIIKEKIDSIVKATVDRLGEIKRLNKIEQRNEINHQVDYGFCLDELNTLPFSIQLEKRKTLYRVRILINKIKIENEVKNSNTLSIDYILIVVCDYFNLSPEMIHAKTRKREIVKARQIAHYFSKSLTKSSLATIGAKIGGKDHATVLHSCKTVNNLFDTDKRYRFQIEEIEKKLKTGKIN